LIQATSHSSLRVALLGALGFTFASCGKPFEAPANSERFPVTRALNLSTGSPTKDEDPFVLRDRDGAMFVAWFSDRGGNSDVYVAKTDSGAVWTTPIRITTDAGGDFYPNLLQDEQGTFHLVWFRWDALYHGHIMYNSSPDGVTWNQGTEQLVTTTADVDDWVPSLARAADGTMLVYFVATKREPAVHNSQIYVASKHPGDVSWSAAGPVASVNSATANDHLPFVARTGNQFTLAWVRYDTSESVPWLNKKSDLFYASSADGLTWSAPTKVTTDAGDIVNLYPELYENQAGQWSFLWLGTRLGDPKPFELPLSSAGQYPQAVAENTQLSPGYSHRVVATVTPGVYLGAWVQGPEGAQDVYYRFFRK
jgi:hypothetical protein